MKTFYTIIPVADAMSLLKDPGIIPFRMQKYGYKSYYVSFLQKKDIPLPLLDAIEGMDIISLKDDRPKGKPFSWNSRAILRYIWKNAKKMDVLNLFFLKYSILYALCYKLRNPRGVLYVKLDFNIYDFKLRETNKIERFRRKVYQWYLNYIPDLVSVESTTAMQYVQNKYNLYAPKLIYIPDGIDDDMVKQSALAIKTFEEKDNIMLTVGRLGTPPKNTELILEAVKQIRWQNGWRFVLVGSVEPILKNKIESLYTARPDLKDKVIFKGEILDRLKLLDIYNAAKVFCLTSRWESFGIVCAEAQYFGNYLLSTPITATSDFIGDDGRIGKVINNIDELVTEMQAIIDNTNDIADSFLRRREHSKRFAWSYIIEQLNTKIEECLDMKTKIN